MRLVYFTLKKYKSLRKMDLSSWILFVVIYMYIYIELMDLKFGRKEKGNLNSNARTKKLISFELASQRSNTYGHTLLVSLACGAHISGRPQPVAGRTVAALHPSCPIFSAEQCRLASRACRPCARFPPPRRRLPHRPAPFSSSHQCNVCPTVSSCH